MNTFQLIITSYNTIIYNDRSVYCGVTTQDGSLGFEAQHEPVLSVLKENSLVKYKGSSGVEKSIQIKNGMLSFNNNECTIIIGVEGSPEASLPQG